MRSLTEGEQLKVAIRPLDQYKSTLTLCLQALDATADSLRHLVVKRQKAFYDEAKLVNNRRCRNYFMLPFMPVVGK